MKDYSLRYLRRRDYFHLEIMNLRQFKILRLGVKMCFNQEITISQITDKIKTVTHLTIKELFDDNWDNILERLIFIHTAKIQRHLLTAELS